MLGVPRYNQPLNTGAEHDEVSAIMRLLSLDMRDSGAPASFWPYAAAHACDVLNNTSRPSGCTKSSSELVTGSRPKVMRILPFGCKIYALIPAQRVGKANPARPRSWLSVNLGRRPEIIMSYFIWVPSTSTLVTTSEVYFNDCVLPFQPPRKRLVPQVLSTATAARQSLSLPLPPALRNDSLPAHRSRTVLLMHTGDHSLRLHRAPPPLPGFQFSSFSPSPTPPNP